MVEIKKKPQCPYNLFTYDAQITTEAELVEAIEKVKGEAADCLCFLECIINR